MIKLLIADDEKIIRETIYSIIDWNLLGIEVVGLCQNGHEAYSMIIDYSPDIVLTDIKMPGMDGLELIEKVYESDKNTQFIILSGYGEFEYAKKAMSYGVREYLLKPCNEEQIIKSIKACIEYRNKGLALPSDDISESQRDFSNNVLFNVINDMVFGNGNIEDIERSYHSYLDFKYTPYRIVYVYYLTNQDRDEFLEDLKKYSKENFPSVTIYGIYVKNTLLIFFKDYDIGIERLLDMIGSWHADTLQVQLETKTVLYQDLISLFKPLIGRIQRYDEIYFINNYRTTYLCNYKTHMANTDALIESVKTGNTDELSEKLSTVTNISFLKQLCSSIILKLSLENSEISSSFLTDTLKDISKLSDTMEIKNITISKVNEINQKINRNHSESTMTRQIRSYVNDNLSNSNITLKYISENVLFMNDDYVSKKFLKETGVKFSTYLSELRIDKAKELLSSGQYTKMQDVATAVGLGNNPQYFSQLFRKMTGKTPSTFISEMN